MLRRAIPKCIKRTVTLRLIKDKPRSQRNNTHIEHMYVESLNVVLSDIDYVINNIDHIITSSLLYTMSIVL